MPMFRRAAYCTTVGTDAKTCAADSSCKWSHTNFVYNLFNPTKITSGSCHINPSTLDTCRSQWEENALLSESMPEVYQFVDGHTLAGHVGKLAKRPLPRAFVYAAKPDPREVELKLEGDFVFTFNPFEDDKADDTTSDASECPKSDARGNYARVGGVCNTWHGQMVTGCILGPMAEHKGRRRPANRRCRC